MGIIAFLSIAASIIGFIVSIIIIVKFFQLTKDTREMKEELRAFRISSIQDDEARIKRAYPCLRSALLKVADYRQNEAYEPYYNRIVEEHKGLIERLIAEYNLSKVYSIEQFKKDLNN